MPMPGQKWSIPITMRENKNRYSPLVGNWGVLVYGTSMAINLIEASLMICVSMIGSVPVHMFLWGAY